MDVHFSADKLVRMRYYLGSGLKAALALKGWSRRMKKLDEERKEWLKSVGADAFGSADDAHGVSRYAMLVWKQKPEEVPPGLQKPVQAEGVWYAVPERSKEGAEIARMLLHFDPLPAASEAMLEELGVEGAVRIPGGRVYRPSAMPLMASGKASLIVPDAGMDDPEAPAAPGWMEEVDRDAFKAAQDENEAAMRAAMQNGGRG